MTATTFPKLQPLGFGELLDRAIRVYRKNFVPFTAMVAIVQTPLVALQILATLLAVSSIPTTPFSPGQPPPDISQVFGPAYFIGQGLNVILSIINFLSTGILYGAIIRGTADSYLSNERVTVSGTFGKVFKAFGRLTLTMLLTILIGIALFIWLIIPCIGWVSGPGLFIFGGWVIFPLILICSTLEGLGPLGAYRRAWDLSRRRFWWTLGFAFVIFLFSMAVTLGPSTLVNIGLGAVLRADFFRNNPALVTAMNTIIVSLVSLAAIILTYPIQAVSFTLMYFDLRVRTEGFDMTLAAADTAIVTSPADLVAQAPKPQSGNPITAKEFGYFCLLGIIAIVPIVLLYGVLFAVLMASFQAMQGGF
jgi:hypothetical protein